MKLISEYATDQYEFVKGSRQVLFDYCETISPDDFINQNTSFGRGGSMRNLLVHIVNTYQYWIEQVSLQRNVTFAEFEDYTTISAVKALFEKVDQFMAEFILLLDEVKQIEYPSRGVMKMAEPFKIFTHVITHEYHHKGQVSSISRHLGYTPVDTDIMR